MRAIQIRKNLGLARDMVMASTKKLKEKRNRAVLYASSFMRPKACFLAERELPCRPRVNSAKTSSALEASSALSLRFRIELLSYAHGVCIIAYSSMCTSTFPLSLSS